MTEPNPQLEIPFPEDERIIHNGQILHPVQGVYDTEAEPVVPKANRQLPPGIPDIDPDQLAGLMAGVINKAQSESPPALPMEIVNRLLQLQTPSRHKAVFTRFDMLQLFALWSNKLEAQRTPR